MSVIKIRPEHVPHVLRMFDVEEGLRGMLVKSEYWGYSRNVLLANLHLFKEDNIFEIVSSIDDLCRNCPKQEFCKETDATLFIPFTNHLKTLAPNEQERFLEKSLAHISKTRPYLARAFPFSYLIGNQYTLEQLKYIDRNPLITLHQIS
jgi:hypothetical protein